MKNFIKNVRLYLVPYPLLALCLILMWLFLNGFAVGQFILSVLVAGVSSFAMRQLEPEGVKISNWRKVFLLCWRVLVDITNSNIATASIILRGGRGKAKSGFMIIPLDLKNRTGLAVLGCILTATPGTAWIAYDTRRSELLLHVLDLDDENYWRQLIKNRYEYLLMEIFVYSPDEIARNKLVHDKLAEHGQTHDISIHDGQTRGET